jgi:hypothetical protein
MARGRAFGFGRWSVGPYSHWRYEYVEALFLGQSELAGELTLPILTEIGAVLVARSSMPAQLSMDALLSLEGALVGNASIACEIRYYWETEPPPACGDDWAPGVPCEAAWAPAAGCDVGWVVQPPPPYACPEGTPGARRG